MPGALLRRKLDASAVHKRSVRRNTLTHEPNSVTYELVLAGRQTKLQKIPKHQAKHTSRDAGINVAEKLSELSRGPFANMLLWIPRSVYRTKWYTPLREMLELHTEYLAPDDHPSTELGFFTDVEVPWSSIELPCVATLFSIVEGQPRASGAINVWGMFSILFKALDYGPDELWSNSAVELVLNPTEWTHIAKRDEQGSAIPSLTKLLNDGRQFAALRSTHCEAIIFPYYDPMTLQIWSDSGYWRLVRLRRSGKQGHIEIFDSSANTVAHQATVRDRVEQELQLLAQMTSFDYWSDLSWTTKWYNCGIAYDRADSGYIVAETLKELAWDAEWPVNEHPLTGRSVSSLSGPALRWTYFKDFYHDALPWKRPLRD